MEPLKRKWQSLPTAVRKPLVLVIGLLFVVAAGLTGWLPGPGGIPLFLIGVAILATEFEWAQRLRDWVIARVHAVGRWWRHHKLAGTLALALGAAAILAAAYLAYRAIGSLR